MTQGLIPANTSARVKSWWMIHCFACRFSDLLFNIYSTRWLNHGRCASALWLLRTGKTANLPIKLLSQVLNFSSINFPSRMQATWVSWSSSHARTGRIDTYFLSVRIDTRGSNSRDCMIMWLRDIVAWSAPWIVPRLLLMIVTIRIWCDTAVSCRNRVTWGFGAILLLLLDRTVPSIGCTRCWRSKCPLFVSPWFLMIMWHNFVLHWHLNVIWLWVFLLKLLCVVSHKEAYQKFLWIWESFERWEFRIAPESPRAMSYHLNGFGIT
jgi:hypothetical protein